MSVGPKDVLIGYEPTLERPILLQIDDIWDAAATYLHTDLRAPTNIVQ
jgi:hypothetical protein